MNPLELRPETLADRVDPADALQALKRAGQLTDAQRLALDYALSYWVLQAVERKGDAQSLHLLDQLCALAARRSGGASAEFAARLSAWRSLLENKRLALATPPRERELLQTDRIVELLAGGPLRQAELAHRLHLSAGRVSQILAVLEEDRVVERQRKGRDNIVSLPGEAPLATSPSAAPASAPLLRPAGFLSEALSKKAA